MSNSATNTDKLTKSKTIKDLATSNPISIGRVGALAVALGIGSAVAMGTPGFAAADTADADSAATRTFDPADAESIDRASALRPRSALASAAAESVAGARSSAPIQESTDAPAVSDTPAIESSAGDNSSASTPRSSASRPTAASRRAASRGRKAQAEIPGADRRAASWPSPAPAAPVSAPPVAQPTGTTVPAPEVPALSRAPIPVPDDPPAQPTVAAPSATPRVAAAVPVVPSWIASAASAQPTATVAPPAAAVTVRPTNLMSGFLKLLGYDSSGATNGVPGAPGEFATAALALVRRQLETALASSGPAAAVYPASAPPAEATTATGTGTTTRINWGWGTRTIEFDPATDKLNFGWMGPNWFSVNELSGSTVVSVFGINNYTLKDVAVGDLEMTNIISYRSDTTTRWKSVITAAQPAVSIADADVGEGNSGTAAMAFAVTLSKASKSPITVSYTTSNGSATAGADFVAGSGTVTFAAGQTSHTVNVGVIGDTAVESDESFTVTLSNASGARLSRAVATGTIVNDDVAPPAPLPSVSIADASRSEGNTGTANMAFTVTLSEASASPVSVGYTTSNGTATAGADFVAGSGTVTFAVGQTSQTVNVGVIGDTAVESDESFTVTLSNPSGATLSRKVATGMILNEDIRAAWLFNGDYSTGDFSQWRTVQTRTYNGDGSAYVPSYSASIVRDAIKGLVARFEVRSGDVPNFGGGERAEVQATQAQTGGTEGQTLWFAFSTKFDPTFSSDYDGWPKWGITNQWHPTSSIGSPPFSFGMTPGSTWSLRINPQSAPGTYLGGERSIWTVPMDRGNWHDIKMQVHFSASDTDGWIRLWHNGVRQNFSNGSDTFYCSTIIPTTTSVYYKEGLYRAPKATTDIVYHAGFRSATTEAGLG